jgi:hypothetical protein
MPKPSAFSGDLLKLIFQGQPITGLAFNASSGPLDHLYLSLHTAALTAQSNQSTSEIVYTGYARVAVPRNTVSWTVADGQLVFNEAFVFPSNTGTSAPVVVTVAVGTDAAGPGRLLYYGAITGTTISANVAPTVLVGSTLTEG